MHPESAALYDRLCGLLAGEPALAPFGLADRARPSVRLTTRRSRDEQMQMGQSRLGGLPDVPPGFDWPRWAPSGDRLRSMDAYAPPAPATPSPLGFVAQIDLGELPRLDDSLPASGWLWFFYDRYVEPWGFHPHEHGSCRVLYSDCDGRELSRILPPDDADLDHVAASCAVETAVQLTLPDLDSIDGMEYGTPACDAYLALRTAFDGSDASATHRLLGNPQLIQNPMELECQLASNGIYCGDPSGYDSDEGTRLAPGAADWRLLLQIDSDEAGPGWMWGDCGRIYFWIKQQDLVARRFDAVWLILQCS